MSASSVTITKTNAKGTSTDTIGFDVKPQTVCLPSGEAFEGKVVMEDGVMTVTGEPKGKPFQSKRYVREDGKMILDVKMGAVEVKRIYTKL